MVCSVGEATPETGTFAISDKYVWRLLEGDVYGQYACRITGSILFHSVPYTTKDKGTLEWWEYDKLGTKASLGCIRLTVEDAKWIYTNCVSGTKVEFYSSSNPGPLGKPTARKISDDVEVRNWDPTDQDSGNPWKDYLKKQEDAKQNSQNVTQNTMTQNTVTNTAGNTTVVPGNNTNVTNQNSTVSNNTVNQNNTSGNTNTTNDVNGNNIVNNTNTDSIKVERSA